MSDPNTLTILLQPDNPCNTTMTDKDTGKLFYQVATEHGAKTITKVKNADEQTIASWEWKDVRSDILTLGNGSPMSSSAWLKKSLVPFKDTVTFDSPDGKTYKWKGNGPGLSFELFSQDDKTYPIAKFKKSHRVKNHKNDPPTYDVVPAQLCLDQRGQAIQDLVVISLLMLEKSRRSREASTMNRADVLASPVTTIGSNYVLNKGGL